eukprot:TRINITY_DN18646_c0_g2_i1.p1 TRINITY_DN18646_c0_g2~~TRINITY_DN18646_c0_g2_i1.p1  ORF type:complete len:169 (+),score=51.00 TRINITY_DN18646_c0_g2_i1:77-583(+)
MDAYSTKKRQEDGILSMALNAPNRVQQRSLSASKLEGLKQESEMAKQWHKKAADDFILTTSNCRGLQKDTKESRVWGGPDYRHVPPRDGQSSEYKNQLQALQRIGSEVTAKQEAIDKAMQNDYRQVRNTQPDTTVSSLQGWLQKYGSPRRQAEPEERWRSTSFKQRRL